MPAVSVRRVLELCVVAVATVAFALTLVGIAASWLTPGALGTRDFVEYWASARLLLQHADPYDSARILALERSVGFPPGIPPLVAANPPSALLLIVPLGYLDVHAAAALWLAALLLCLWYSVQQLRQMHGRPQNLIHLLGYGFAPALSCLLSGQITLFLLFGLVLFLRFHGTRPVLAGAALWFCLLKPHLFLPFGVVMLVWIVTTRAYKILLGASCAFGASTAIVLLYDRAVWAQYRHMMSVARLDRIAIPCFSMLLRQHVAPHSLEIQSLPAALGCVWALVYYYRRHRQWSWLEHGSPLMLVSVLVAPYTWFMDQCVAIPALLHGAYLTRSQTLLALLALGSALIEIEILRGVPLLHGILYAWAPPAWLIWYLLARNTGKSAPLDRTPGNAAPSHAAETTVPASSNA